MRKNDHLIVMLAFALLLSLVACGTPAAENPADDPAGQQQIEVNKDKNAETDKPQDSDKVNVSADKIAPGDEKKDDETTVTLSGSTGSGTNSGSTNNADTDSNSALSPSGTGSNTGSSGNSGSNSNSNTSTGSNTNPGPVSGSTDNTGSSNNSGTSSDVGNTSNAGSNPTGENNNASTSNNNSGSDQQPSSDSESNSGSTDSTPVHTHTWTDADTAVVCYECGAVDHIHNWESVYTTEVVDDYEMQPKNYCSTCDQDITDLLASGASMKQHKKATGCASAGYYGNYIRVKVGSHEEQILIGYKCSICETLQCHE